MARSLAEAGAAQDTSAPPGGQLQVQIAGFGDGRRLERTDESARQTGQRRADAVRAWLLAGVRDYLRQLGADPVIADSLLPAWPGDRRAQARARDPRAGQAGSGHRAGLPG